MESQPHNPEFRINPENFHPCKRVAFTQSHLQTDTGGLTFTPPDPFRAFVTDHFYQNILNSDHQFHRSKF